MPGRGRQPKDPARSQRHGEKGHRSVAKTARDPAGAQLIGLPGGKVREKVPAVTAAWLPRIREEWRDLWRSDLARAFEDTDIPELRRLFKLKNEREIAQQVVDEAGQLIKGSQGQIVLNPLLRKIDAYDGHITAIADRFGLNPRSRLGLGFTFAETHMSLERMNQMFRQVAAEAEAAEDPRIVAIQAADPRKK